MDDSQFDDLVRQFATSRRVAFGVALAGPLTALGLAGADAKKRKKNKKKKKCKACTECQVCKKGKCKPKPEGSACIGGLCGAGGCACFNGFRSCQGQCIPDDQCCDAADCGQGGSCQNGTCICLDGFKRCGNRCIAATRCCSNSDCPSGKSCLSSGSCAQTCPPYQCPGTCQCTALIDNDNEVVCFSYGNPPAPACGRPACDAHSDCGAGEQCLQFDCSLNGVFVGRCLPLC